MWRIKNPHHETKHHKGEKVNMHGLMTNTTTSTEEEIFDRISQLPDPLIHKILSFLVTKDAAKTIILSKRWKSLWTSIPILDFGGPPFDLPAPPASSTTAFRRRRITLLLMDFVDRVLFNHQENSTIVRFRLYCNEYCESSRLYSWLSFIIRLKIQHLDLIFHKRHQNFIFPYSLFTSESPLLTVFKLEMSCDFKLPTSNISFPSLKILSLKYVTFCDDYSTEKLLSNCPVLEELYLIDCKWVKMNMIKISGPALKRLQIRDDRYFGLGNCELKVFAQNINSLVVIGNLPKNFESCNFPCIVDAFVNVGDKSLEERTIGVHQLALKFLEPLSNVQDLVIGKDIAEARFHDENLLFGRLPFKNLTSLTLSWGYNRLAYTTLVNMLHTAPNLENLVLFKAKCEYNNYGFSAIPSVPQCLLLHLKRIKITEICGNQSERNMIKFFSEKSRVLETLAMTYNSSSSKEWLDEFRSWMSTIPRSSKSCLFTCDMEEDLV